MSKTVVVLHSALPPRQVRDALRRTVETGELLPFSRAGYRADGPLTGRIEDNTFWLRKRIRGRSSYPRQFNATFLPGPGGTRIEGRFNLPTGTKWFNRIWLGFVVLFGVPLFLQTLLGVMEGTIPLKGGAWAGLLLPPALLLYGILLPRLGNRLSAKDEEVILEFLEKKLHARVEKA